MGYSDYCFKLAGSMSSARLVGHIFDFVIYVCSSIFLGCLPSYIQLHLYLFMVVPTHMWTTFTCAVFHGNDMLYLRAYFGYLNFIFISYSSFVVVFHFERSGIAVD